MAGKGDKRRPRFVSREEYERRFEKAFTGNVTEEDIEWAESIIEKRENDRDSK